jgi:hypothetical protein
MRSLSSTAASAVVIVMALAGLAHGQLSHIFFDTTGDFGLASNWSDPAKAPQAGVPADSTNIYYINGNRTATIAHDSPNGSHFVVSNLFLGDSPPGQSHTPGTLIMEGGPEPAPGQFGASLTVSQLHQFRLALNCEAEPGAPGACTGGGTMIMNGASDLLAPGLIVGDRGRGELYIGPDARVRALTADGNLNRTDIRIGTFGPVFNHAEQTIDGNGLIEVAGTLVGNTIYMPQDDGDAVLRVMPGGVVNVRGVDMSFHSFQPNRSSLLEIIGSGGSFTTTVGNLQVNHPTATLKFTADAAGVTPIVSIGITQNPPLESFPPGGANVSNGNLVLDLDDFNFTPTSTLMLIDVGVRDEELGANKLTGTFGSVTFEGDTMATVNYDYVNGDIFLSNFVSTEPPGISGDYNDDGIVDAADYVVWRKFNGTLTTLPNDETSGSVLPVDYDVWREHFGEGNLGSSSTAAPEPTAFASALLLIACGAGMRATSSQRT